MTIVAWDGNTLAVDRLGDAGDLRNEIIKARVSPTQKCVMAWTGGIAEGLAMAYWFETDRLKHAMFPACQNTERWARLIVADSSGVVYFEREPFEIMVKEKFMAWGSGRDFAIGALAMGATAKEAVEVVCQHALSCGLPVDVFNLKEL